MDKIKRAIFVRLALMLRGTPYVWGGEFPYDGLDCSGLVVFCLKAIGAIGEKVDMTADSLYDILLAAGKIEPLTPGYLPNTLKPGNVVFYGDGKRITHIAIVTGTLMCVSARGGSVGMTRGDAQMKSAKVSDHVWNYRSDTVAVGDMNIFFEED